ncbi:MAG TPA: DUF2520 domain-containing protein [Acidimicrobiia bacterium]
MDGSSRSEFALIGPGRAGTAVATALVARGWTPTAVAGRSAEAPSTRRVASLLGVPAVPRSRAGVDADVVLVATPDSEIAGAAAALAPSLRTGALVLHLSGARSLHELDDVVRARPDVEVGSLHPLQSLPSGDVGRARLAGSWCAVEGPAAVERIALTLGMRPFRLPSGDRIAYHAAACVASNHLVALMGQVERLAAAAGVPAAAFLPLVRATLDNVDELGPVAALTGPVARGDADTVAAHLDALPAEEREAYRALAAVALRLVPEPDAAVMSAVVEGVPAS